MMTDVSVLGMFSVLFFETRYVNSGSPCLGLLSAEVPGMCQPAWLKKGQLLELLQSPDVTQSRRGPFCAADLPRGA